MVPDKINFKIRVSAVVIESENDSDKTINLISRDEKKWKKLKCFKPCNVGITAKATHL